MQKSFSIHPLKLGRMDNFIYIIQDHSSKKAAVVDPAWDIPKVIEFAQQHDLQITDILLTHTHDDHINGLNEILRISHAQVHLLQGEIWDSNVESILHEDGDIIQLGQTQIEVWHTPGHTPGSACYYLEGNIITGDTLFVLACGRCDLQGGNLEQMYHSLKKLGTLPPETVIYPGHHYGQQPTSTIAEELSDNPFMQFDNLTDFLHYRGH
ncbi:MAG: MBL fold metallo-hydrolase [Thiotrichaceae bacterium]|nr:MBL fold metallo-hydrolase [Thiotrichaceae bacterium]